MNELSKIQKEAVMYCDGPELIVAGAGSGKTRVLTYKIAYLIAAGIKPERIMALTFTNKAAKEMKDRLAAMVGADEASKLQMGTFHSVFAKILKEEAYFLGYNSRFTIYDEADSRNVLKAIIKDMKFDKKEYKPSKIAARISMAKNNLISAEDYSKIPMILEEDTKNKIQYCGEIYEKYQTKLKSSNAMDFDDLLQLVYTLFQDKVAIRMKYQDAYDYILVDEFQDTNVAQMEILKQLCLRKQNLVVVGDDAQSIYSFRGANINNILMFNTIFPKARTFKLEQNYRSSSNIVAAANSLIHHNVAQIEKNVFSTKQSGELVHYLPFFTDRNEAEYIAQSVREVHRVEQCPFSAITILYRNNALSRCIEESLMNYKIPYIIHGAISFYQRKEIKDVMSYFKIISNPSDDDAFSRCINYPKRGIGPKTIELIKLAADKYKVPMLYIAAEPDYFALKVSEETKKKLKDFAEKINRYTQEEVETEGDDMANKILDDMNLYEALNDGKEEDVAKINNLNELMSSIESYVAQRKDEGRQDEIFLHNFLQDIALLAEEQETKLEDAVNLMTIHASKGLEFNTIYVAGLEENIFPSKKTSTSPQELEEERRLLYVAITRAEKRCFLTSAKKRWLYGEEQRNETSRFIKEIDRKYMEEIDPYEVDPEEEENSQIQGYFD